MKAKLTIPATGVKLSRRDEEVFIDFQIEVSEGQVEVQVHMPSEPFIGEVVREFREDLE